METWDAIRARRNVRTYLPDPVPGADLDRIAEAGWRAPSASNRQHWNFIIVTDRDQLQALSRVWQGAKHIAGAPAAAGRLVYSLSRDRMLPYSRQLATVSPRSHTPIPALVSCGVIMIALTVWGYFQSNAFGTLVGATSLAPYIVYLLIVVAYIVRRRTMAQVKGGFNLGRFGIPVMLVALSILLPKKTLVGLAGQKAWHICTGEALPRVSGKYLPSQLRTQKAGPPPPATGRGAGC